MCVSSITTAEKVQYKKVLTINTELESSVFSNNGDTEVHLMCKSLTNESFDKQLQNTISSIQKYILDTGMAPEGLIALRFFVSDCANQMDYLSSAINQLKYVHGPCAISIVQQPVLSSGKVAIWAHIINPSQGVKKCQQGDYFKVNWLGYEHVYHSQLLASDKAETSYQQTNEIFNQFNNDLISEGMLMKDHCIRTWIYVKDVDYNYNGVVVSRREFFEDLGMNKHSHFITSTGIEGRHFDYNKSVLMDAYSINAIESDKVKFLTALDYLNHTHEYGVTFERGTSVDFNDRRHIYLSGTASIDNKGEVVHPHQIDKQIERTLINVAALLKDADADMTDIAQLIIYLRDIGDKDIVETYFQNNHIDIPKVIVLAPVCRPGWLIEMECIAIKDISE